MTYRDFKPRPALTAIAAVMAISSTPVLAQDASVPEPVIDSTPVTATPDPLSPEPVTTIETPVAEPAPAKKASAAKTASKPASATRRTASAASAPRAPARAATEAAPPVAAPSAAEALPPAPVEAPPAVELSAPPPAPAEPVAQAVNMDEALPIAGATGLGLLALAGAGLAMRRRKRRHEEEEFEAHQAALADANVGQEPVATPEPAFARTPPPLHDPVPTDSPVTTLPASFDLSRFGRHVQAAYRGPTADNPSLSLKNRLRRASFFDQQERRAAEEGKAAAKPVEQPAWTAKAPNSAEFMFRPAPSRPAPRPAFQK
jgi:hypothetical protein